MKIRQDYQTTHKGRILIKPGLLTAVSVKELRPQKKSSSHWKAENDFSTPPDSHAGHPYQTNQYSMQTCCTLITGFQSSIETAVLTSAEGGWMLCEEQWGKKPHLWFKHWNIPLYIVLYFFTKSTRCSTKTLECWNETGSATRKDMHKPETSSQKLHPAGSNLPKS